MADHRHPIVVGVDGGVESATALRWAIAEARSRELPLRLVHAYRLPPGYPPPDWYPDGEGYDTAGITSDANGLLDDAVAEAREIAADLVVDGSAVEGRGAEVLVEESRQAALVILGSRRLGPLAGALLGSVSSSVVSRAHCPVVVVRGNGTEPGRPGLVVVGVDDEQPSDRVLGFGFEYARRTRALLRAVLCRRPHPPDRTAGPEPASGEARERVVATLHAVLARWQGVYPAVEVDGRIVDAPQPTTALVDQADHADLLVVGARARRRRTGALLGSVSQGVLHHARCPVAVLHGSE